MSPPRVSELPLRALKRYNCDIQSCSLEAPVRRFIPALLVFLVLLIIGGVAVTNYVVNPPLTRGGYIPTITSETEGLMFLGGIVVTLLVMGGMGHGLGVALQTLGGQVAKLEADAAAKAKANPAPKPAPKPAAAKEATPEPYIPFTSNRSVIALLVGVVLFTVGLQAPKYIGLPIGYIPGITEAFSPKVAGLPVEMSEMQLLIGVLVATVVLTLIAGAGLSLLFKVLDQQVKKAEPPPAPKPAPAAKPAAPAK